MNENNFDSLILRLYNTHSAFQRKAQQTVNRLLTIRNWLAGYYIVEFQQHGKDRAKYGENLLNEIASIFKEKNISGFSVRSLYDYRNFYITYPQILQTLFAELQKPEYKEINNFLFPVDEKKIRQFRQAHLAEIGTDFISPDMLLSQLSYSHFLELIKVEDSLQRNFYEVETIKNNWSYNELKRAIGTSLASRTTLSKDKEAIIAKINNEKPAINSVIRNPYILEFLDIEEKAEFNESDLENSILNHIQKFLMELGTGFCFEARQKRINFDNNHFYVDLVFYHRILKCHVLIELKIGESHYADAAQINLYLNYYKKDVMLPDDNPPIGIILCASKNEALVEYTTTGIDSNLFVSQYLLKLPDKKLLERIIKEELE